jgi:hypothetical protein
VYFRNVAALDTKLSQKQTIKTDDQDVHETSLLWFQTGDFSCWWLKLSFSDVIHRNAGDLAI